ncbi:MAG: glycine zipper family protein [Burkholderiales bacterium]
MTCTRHPVCMTGAFLILLTTGCASSPHPVLYPNAQYQRAGETQAQRDIDACYDLADRSGVSRTADGKVARRTAEGAAVGGAAGAAVGAVRGNDIGRAAGAGAAGGAAAGAARGAFKSTDQNPTWRNFVQRCLREKGYDVIGWDS